MTKSNESRPPVDTKALIATMDVDIARLQLEDAQRRDAQRRITIAVERRAEQDLQRAQRLARTAHEHYRRNP